MDLQIPHVMLPHDAMSWPEEEISINPRCLSYFTEEYSELANTNCWMNELRRFLLSELENPGSKIAMQFSFDREDICDLSCYRNAHWKLLCLWVSLRWKSLIFTRTGCQMIGLLRALGECPRNHFTAPSGSRHLISMNKVKQMNNTGNRFYLDNNESCVVFDIDLMEAFDRGGKMTSELHWFDRKLPRDPMFQHGDTFNQHKRKNSAECVASFVVSTFAFLGIFFNLWGRLSIIQVQPLHKEHPASIWPPLLGLLGLMVFVWAVAIMILAGAPFTHMQSAMLIFWAILMLL